MEDRHFICEDCGTKWFLPAARRHEPDPTACGACGGALRPVVAAVPAEDRRRALA